jgi:hypothetical protein
MKESEYYIKTMSLRIFNGVLQQMWQGSEGTQEWKDVEIINK